LTDDRLQSEKTSRFWWLPEWLWRGVIISVVAGIIILALKKLASMARSALRAVKLRPIMLGIGRAVWRVSPTLAFVLGFIFQQNVLTFAGMLTLSRSIGTVGAFAAIALYFHFVAKDHLRGFKEATQAVGGRCWNIVIGGLSKSFFDLATGLLPFWQNPWIFVVLGLYFGLILDVVSMKRWFGRAVRLTSQSNADGASNVRYGL
jgi:hypothetical protein